ncbi:MAG: YfiR family protein [Bacteroidia bacterium]
MKKLLFILLSFVLFTSSTMVKPGDSEEANAKIKAIYIYNFTKYIEWPESYQEGSFVIGYIGNNTALLTELSKLAASKKAGNQSIEIRNISKLDDNSKYHIIFILADNSTQLAEVLAKTKGKSTLIVTEKPGLAQKGAGINFIVEDNKQKIELSKENISKYKLKVAETLVKLSNPVN